MSKSKTILPRTAAISNTEIIFAGMSDDFEPYTPYTAMYRHRYNHPEKQWRYLDFDFHTASICKFFNPDISQKEPYYVALSSEGDVYHHGLTEGFTERIKGAGLYHEDAIGYGRMTSIRQIGDKLYACGSGGQVYIRHDRDDWRFLTKELLWDPDAAYYDADDMPDDEKEPKAYAAWEKAYDEAQKDNIDHLLYNINGPSEDEIYICGEDGLLYLWDGETLEDMETDIPHAITKIHVADDGVVWMCGRKGQILSIDPENGLEDFSNEENKHLFTSVTTYQNRVFFVSNAGPWGLFEFIPETETLTEVIIDKDYPPEWLHTVEAMGDVLWVVGTQDIFRFHNNEWERINHPEIPPPSER